MNHTKEEILASLDQKDKLEQRAKNLTIDDVEHLLKDNEAKIRAEYVRQSPICNAHSKPSNTDDFVNDATSPTMTKKNAALEVVRYLFEKRSMGLIITLGSFGVYIAAMNPKLKMFITLAFIGLGLYNLVTAQIKLKQLNDKYNLDLKLDFKQRLSK